MSDFKEIIKQVEKRELPYINKRITLKGGEKISSDEDIVSIASKTVPQGKVAEVAIVIKVLSISDEPTEEGD